VRTVARMRVVHCDAYVGKRIEEATVPTVIICNCPGDPVFTVSYYCSVCAGISDNRDRSGGFLEAVVCVMSHLGGSE
jgi:hypothetical protein